MYCHSFDEKRGSNSVSPRGSQWEKIAQVILTKGPKYQKQMKEFEEYFELKMLNEKMTEKYPFVKDPAIAKINERRLEIAKEKAR